VLSETAACRTLGEGVALIEAAQRSDGIYMFAENYPYMPFTREMQRRYQAGQIGEVRYAEAEYLDEPADLAWLVNDRAHWRARTPPPTTAPTRWPRSPRSPALGRCR
jgi:predicted dehydrogenase